MLTLEYLKSILFKEETETVVPMVRGLDKPDWVLESAAGYDGIIELIQTKGLPVCVVLEHNEVGNFSMHQGGFEQTSQSIWVMEIMAELQNHEEHGAAIREQVKQLILDMGED